VFFPDSRAQVSRKHHFSSYQQMYDSFFKKTSHFNLGAISFLIIATCVYEFVLKSLAPPTEIQVVHVEFKKRDIGAIKDTA
jgi:hypothetical protein